MPDVTPVANVGAIVYPLMRARYSDTNNDTSINIESATIYKTSATPENILKKFRVCNLKMHTMLVLQSFKGIQIWGPLLYIKQTNRKDMMHFT